MYDQLSAIAKTFWHTTITTTMTSNIVYDSIDGGGISGTLAQANETVLRRRLEYKAMNEKAIDRNERCRRAMVYYGDRFPEVCKALTGMCYFDFLDVMFQTENEREQAREQEREQGREQSQQAAREQELVVEMLRSIIGTGTWLSRER